MREPRPLKCPNCGGACPYEEGSTADCSNIEECGVTVNLAGEVVDDDSAHPGALSA